MPKFESERISYSLSAPPRIDPRVGNDALGTSGFLTATSISPLFIHHIQ
jgi:hypothetical protein